jgi:hypothetical protein
VRRERLVPQEEQEEAYIQAIKIVLQIQLVDACLEEDIQASNFIPKLRACLESSDFLVQERLTRYIINIVRQLKTPQLAFMAFNELLLNPLIVMKMSRKSLIMFLEFVSIYYETLRALPGYERYLSKRLLLMDVPLP